MICHSVLFFKAELWTQSNRELTSTLRRNCNSVRKMSVRPVRRNLPSSDLLRPELPGFEHQTAALAGGSIASYAAAEVH
jgi:hypothetical protein